MVVVSALYGHMLLAVRRVMRFEIQGYRIRYGVPIFVTFSPDEAHNMLMIRLSRTRRNDPIFIDLCKLACKNPILDICDVKNLPGIPYEDAHDVFAGNWRFFPTLDPQVTRLLLDSSTFKDFIFPYLGG